MFAGLRQEPADVLTTTFDLGHDELVLVRDIEVYSTCEHHLVPFHGVAHVGYIPAADGRITGLSKLARLVDVYARRPAGAGAADHPDRRRPVERLEPAGVHRRRRVRAPVHVDARRPQARRPHRHLAVRGQLRDPATRAEAMSLMLAPMTRRARRAAPAGSPAVGRAAW